MKKNSKKTMLLIIGIFFILDFTIIVAEDESLNHDLAYSSTADQRVNAIIFRNLGHNILLDSVIEIWYNNTPGDESLIGVGLNKYKTDFWNTNISLHFNITREIKEHEFFPSGTFARNKEYIEIVPDEFGVNHSYTSADWTEFEKESFFEYFQWSIDLSIISDVVYPDLNIEGTDEAFGFFAKIDSNTDVYTVISRTGDNLNYFFALEYDSQIMDTASKIKIEINENGEQEIEIEPGEDQAEIESELESYVNYYLGSIVDNATGSAVNYLGNIHDEINNQISNPSSASSDSSHKSNNNQISKPTSASEVKSSSVERVNEFASTYSLNLESTQSDEEQENSDETIPGYHPLLIILGVIAAVYLRLRFSKK